LRRFKSRRTYAARKVRQMQHKRLCHRRRQGAKDNKPQSGLDPKLTKKGGSKYTAGTRGSKWMVVAIADGRVVTTRCFHKWNSERAMQVSKAIHDDLKRLFPEKPIGDWWVVRDGDPSQKCQANVEIEKKLGFLKVFKLPPRSPALMPLDASFWCHVENQVDTAADAPGTGCPPPDTPPDA
jgi:hypothetical protein